MSRNDIKRAGMALALVLILAVLATQCVGVAEEPVPRSASNYGWLREEQITVSATGSAGAATGSGTSDNPIQGRLQAVHLDFASSITNTTDITLTTSSAPSLTILQLSNYYTDTWYYPAAEYTNSAGSGLSAYDHLPMADYLSVSVGETTSSTTLLTVTAYWGE